MKLETRDLIKMRWHLLAAAVMAALAGGLILWSQAAEQGADQERAEAQARYNQIDNQLRQVRIEEQRIKNESDLFLRLKDRGVVGDERRLEWTETLRELQQEMRLPQMNYEFAPQKDLEDGGRDNLFRQSPMKLHLQLLHEEDLLNFLGRLQQRAQALIVTRSCTLTRLPATATERKDTLAQLDADCQLDWVTLRALEGQR